jgi:hypothetical protein
MVGLNRRALKGFIVVSYPISSLTADAPSSVLRFTSYPLTLAFLVLGTVLYSKSLIIASRLGIKDFGSCLILLCSIKKASSQSSAGVDSRDEDWTTGGSVDESPSVSGFVLV